MGYLPKDWEETTCIELLQMVQNNSNFWDFSMHVQAKNSILIRTPSHLDDAQLRHRLESGMNPKLTLCCHLKKAGTNKDNAPLTLVAWLNAIKDVDELICTEQADFHELAMKAHESTRRSNMLAKPSRRVNTNNMNSSNMASSSNRPVLPKLTSTERQLLYDNEGCLKCHRIYVTHRSNSCPKDFPEPTPYKPLMQSFVDLIKKCLCKLIAAVLDDDNFVLNAPTTPVAAVIGTVNSPTAYMPTNTENVIEGDSGSDSEVHMNAMIAAVTTAIADSVLKAQNDLAPLTVPHFFWRACVNGGQDGFPIIFDALLDHGSHTVLISETFTVNLSLKRHKLHEPMSVEIAMPRKGKKVIVKLFKWVKLKLYDLSGAWTSKTLRTMIGPSLCANVILGGPFLAHNNIVIDHGAWTAINKTMGFDLLNPSAAEPVSKPKMKLKELNGLHRAQM